MNLPINKQQYLLWIDHIPSSYLNSIGRKASILAKLSTNDISVPKTFIVLPHAFNQIIKENHLIEKIHHQISSIDSFNPQDVFLASKRIQQLIMSAEIPKSIGLEIINAYHKISDTSFVAIRGSKVDAQGFISHQKPFLSIRGDTNVIEHIKKMWAGYFSHKYINTYANTKQDISSIDISIIVEHMINSDSSGIVFTNNPGGYDKNNIYVNAVWGIRNEYIDSSPYPDLYTIDKKNLKITQKEVIEQHVGIKQKNGNIGSIDIPHKEKATQKLSDENILKLVKISKQIQKLFFFPQKIEWAQTNNRIYILDSQNINPDEPIIHPKKINQISPLNNLKQIGSGTPIVDGLVTGPLTIINHRKDISKIKPKNIVYSSINYLKILPLSKISGIIFKDGSSLNEAIILIKDLGIPSIIINDPLLRIKSNSIITLNSKTGLIYQGSFPANIIHLPKTTPKNSNSTKTITKLYINISKISDFDTNLIDGVGILRAENLYDRKDLPLPNSPIKDQTTFINKLTSNINSVGETFKGKPVLYRLSDDKSFGLLGLRGVSRHFMLPDTLKLEAKAFIRAKQRNKNLHILLPFVRTNLDIKKAKKVLSDFGIKRSQNLKIWIMAEVPSCVLSLKDCIDTNIDGVVIGLNDLTMLTLGVDRNEASLLEIYNNKHPSISSLIKKSINICNQEKIPCILAGENINIQPDIIEKSVKWGVNGISVSPKSIPITKTYIINSEKRLVGAKI